MASSLRPQHVAVNCHNTEELLDRLRRELKNSEWQVVYMELNSYHVGFFLYSKSTRTPAVASKGCRTICTITNEPIKEALNYSRGRAGVFARTEQGARSAVGSLPMSDELLFY